MKRLHLFFFSVALTLTLAACGSSTSTTSGTGYGNTNTAPTATTGTAGEAVLNTASATVNGKTVTLLTNAQGMTLYYFLPDTATTAACTGGCISIWPPYLSKAIGSAGALPGKLTLQTNANGQQVAYNGHPLYVYSGDTSPGQTNGEGIQNKWFVATSDLTTNTGNAPAPTATSGGTSGY